MNKTWIIIKREYLTRVKNRTFLLSTFLFPVVLMLFIAGSIFFAVQGRKTHRVAVANDPGYFKNNLESDSSTVIFDFSPGVDSNNYEKQGYDGILYLARDSSRSYQLISKKSFGMRANSFVRSKINKAIEHHELEERGINKKTLDSIYKKADDAVNLEERVKKEDGQSEQTNAGLAYGIGFGSGILIYITMFIFGAMVMRGVMEEKMNRVAEVIVSSCKPFQLMMGKIIGIAGVGITQLLLWILLIIVLISSLQFFFPADTLQQVQDAQQNMPGAAQNNSVALSIMKTKNTFVNDVPWLLILGCFLFYFLGGYLFYAALFAAIGSVVNEDPQEAQSLMLPVTMPIIFGFIILSSSADNPDSPAAFWASLIPFTSPIVMMGRIAHGVPDAVPVWQLLLSMALLIVGFLFTTWFAGKVYRTGILLYGKKPSWKEMIKWARRSS